MANRTSGLPGRPRRDPRLLTRVLALATCVALGCASCGHSSPTSPSTVTAAPSTESASLPAGQTRSSVAQSFVVSGAVTNSAGLPVPGVHINVYSLSFIGGRPAEVTTDAAGHYEIGFSVAIPTASSPADTVVGLEATPDDYEWYRTGVKLTTPLLVENVRLRPRQYVQAGDSTHVSISRDNGGCWQLFSSLCARVRIRVATSGMLTVAASTAQLPPTPLDLYVTATSGEYYGNPVSVPVSAGMEVWVEVGVTPTPATDVDALVTTSFTPS